MVEIKGFFKINGSYKLVKYSFLFSILFGLLSYNLFIIYGYTNPDGIIEGLTSYINATWHIAGCGRWMLPIILLISANVHMPLLTVMAYITLMWLSAFTIAKLWKINSLTLVTLFSLVMSVNKATIDHITTNTVALPYAIACYLAVLFVYVLFEIKGKSKYLLSTICLTCSLGIYQTYIGLSACLVLMTIVIKLIKSEEENLLKTTVNTIVCALLSCALYLIALKVILLVFNLSSSGRVKDISISNILVNLIPQIKNIYFSYFELFNDHILYKNVIYIVFGIVLCILLFIILFKTHQLKRILIIACILLIPAASCCSSLIVTENITTNMCYQFIMIIPFTLAIVYEIYKLKYLKYILVLLTVILSWTNLISANATFRCYQLSHDSIKYQMSLIMNDVLHNNDYVLNESKVLFIGYPNDNALRKNINTYKYAYHFDEMENIVFWNGISPGMTYNRKNYVLDYFGIDIKDITEEECEKIIDSEVFNNMNIWPKENSIKYINGILVVKLANSNY